MESLLTETERLEYSPLETQEQVDFEHLGCQMRKTLLFHILVSLPDRSCLKPEKKVLKEVVALAPPVPIACS